MLSVLPSPLTFSTKNQLPKIETEIQRNYARPSEGGLFVPGLQSEITRPSRVPSNHLVLCVDMNLSVFELLWTLLTQRIGSATESFVFYQGYEQTEHTHKHTHTHTHTLVVASRMSWRQHLRTRITPSYVSPIAQICHRLKELGPNYQTY